MKLTEFFAEIFFKTNPLPLKDLIKNIGELNARTILAGVGLDGIYVKLKQITDQSIATAMSLNIFGKSTNLPIEGAQRFANAVSQLGGNSQEAMNDLAQLQERLIKIKKLGTPDAGINQALYWLNNKGRAGISSLGTDPIALIDKMRNAFQRLDKETQVLMLSQLGLSQSSALYLRMSDAQWANQKMNMAANERQIEIITRMGGKWRSLSQTLSQLGMDVTEQTAPALEHLAKVLSDNLAVMERGGAVKTLADAMKTAAGWAESLGHWIEKIGTAYYKMRITNEDFLAKTNPVAYAVLNNQPTSGIVQHNSIMVNAGEGTPAGIAQQIAREIEQAIKKATYQDGGKRL